MQNRRCQSVENFHPKLPVPLHSVNPRDVKYHGRIVRPISSVGPKTGPCGDFSPDFPTKTVKKTIPPPHSSCPPIRNLRIPKSSGGDAVEEGKVAHMMHYVKDYCMYRISVTPDKELIPTPHSAANTAWRSVDEAYNEWSGIICSAISKRDLAQHRKMQREHKAVEPPTRYRLRLQSFLKGPVGRALVVSRLSGQSDDQKVRVLLSMMESVMARDDDIVQSEQRLTDQWDEGTALSPVPPINVTPFTLKKLEDLFILVGRHFCFYCSIRMDFMTNYIVSAASKFLVEKGYFDWVVGRLGGFRGWAGLYSVDWDQSETLDSRGDFSHCHRYDQSSSWSASQSVAQSTTRSQFDKSCDSGNEKDNVKPKLMCCLF